MRLKKRALAKSACSKRDEPPGAKAVISSSSLLVEVGLSSTVTPLDSSMRSMPKADSWCWLTMWPALGNTGSSGWLGVSSLYGARLAVAGCKTACKRLSWVGWVAPSRCGFRLKTTRFLPLVGSILRSHCCTSAGVMVSTMLVRNCRRTSGEGMGSPLRACSTNWLPK